MHQWNLNYLVWLINCRKGKLNYPIQGKRQAFLPLTWRVNMPLPSTDQPLPLWSGKHRLCKEAGLYFDCQTKSMSQLKPASAISCKVCWLTFAKVSRFFVITLVICDTSLPAILYRLIFCHDSLCTTEQSTRGNACLNKWTVIWTSIERCTGKG